MRGTQPINIQISSTTPCPFSTMVTWLTTTTISRICPQMEMPGYPEQRVRVEAVQQSDHKVCTMYITYIRIRDDDTDPVILALAILALGV